MKVNDKNCHHIIVDWGTTNFRAFVLSKDHKVISSKSLALGFLHIAQNSFAHTLQQVLEEWLFDYQHLPVYMAGMVGSLKGWKNVDYVNTPADAQALVTGCEKFTLPWGAQAFIMPGVCHQYEAEKFDVMRGEEIQALGLAQLQKQQQQFAIFPGTHSKHISLNNDLITCFSSYLTGEMYDVLLKHSLLGTGLSEYLIKEPNQDADKSDSKTSSNATEIDSDDDAFLKGVIDAQKGEFTQRIFLVWTQRLFKHLKDGEIPNYLSGMLIGFEMKNIPDKQMINLVGSPALCHKYQLAAKTLGFDAKIIDGNMCFLVGMAELINAIDNLN